MQAQKVLEDPIIHLIAVNKHCTLRSVLGLMLFNIFIDDQVDVRECNISKSVRGSKRE